MISIQKKPTELKYTVFVLLLIAALPLSAQNIHGTASGALDTIFVSPPKGELETDRTSILSALDLVQTDGTIQFATGTYLVGKGISVKVPGVTLIGHPEGTIIRGCDPGEMEDRKFATVNCNGIELAGSNQTVRGFIFEYTYWALHLGCCRNERIKYEMPDSTFVEGSAIYNIGGGHLVEDNTFRFSMSGIRMNGDWEEPAIVRNNRFLNNWHGVSINGNTVHLFDNSFSVPEPAKIPASEFAWDAVKIGPPLPMQGVEETYLREGSGNIISNNKIEDYHQGISIAVYEPGTSCRKNIISDNTINVRRARVLTPENFTLNHQFDSTFVGVPIALLNFPEALAYNAAGQESFIENNIIEGNEITGAEGLGIEILYSSQNRILNNTIEDITVREPFPGNVMDPRKDKLEWEKANGSGIWISPGSSGNEIIGNTFENIASYAVFLEGDSNRVVMPNLDNEMKDLGAGNDENTNRYTGPVIDMHLHAGPGSNESDYYKVQDGEEPDEARIRTLLADMQFHNVTYGILNGPPLYVERFRRASSVSLIGSIIMPCIAGRSPNFYKCFENDGDWPYIEDLKADIAAGRIGAIGELYNVYTGISPLDPQMEPFLELAAKHDLIVTVHAEKGPPPESTNRSAGCCPNFNGDLGDPALWFEVLERYPKLRLVLYHAFSPEFVESAIKLMDTYSGVVVETSPMTIMPLPLVHAALQRYVEAGHGDRVVFGSDYLGAIGGSIAVIEASPLSDEVKRDILYYNAARFLRLSEEEVTGHHNMVNQHREN